MGTQRCPLLPRGFWNSFLNIWLNRKTYNTSYPVCKDDRVLIQLLYISQSPCEKCSNITSKTTEIKSKESITQTILYSWTKLGLMFFLSHYSDTAFPELHSHLPESELISHIHLWRYMNYRTLPELQDVTDLFFTIHLSH